MGGGRAPMPQEVTWKLTRELTAPAKPREINYEPKTFQAYYYAGNKPDIHIFPGDIVHTSSVDSAGVDRNGKRLALGGNANIGPIYVEGALPGDTLVVHLIKIEPNRKTARQGSRIQQFGVTPATIWLRSTTRASMASINWITRRELRRLRPRRLR